MAQGLAHHRAADAEPLAQHALHEPLTRAELAIEDGVAQPLDGELAQGLRGAIDPQGVSGVRLERHGDLLCLFLRRLDVATRP